MGGRLPSRIGLLAVIVTVLPLAACGVKSTPRFPEGATYLRQYPTALPPLEVKEEKPAERRPSVADPEGFYRYPNRPPGQ